MSFALCHFGAGSHCCANPLPTACCIFFLSLLTIYSIKLDNYSIQKFKMPKRFKQTSLTTATSGEDQVVSLNCSKTDVDENFESTREWLQLLYPYFRYKEEHQENNRTVFTMICKLCIPNTTNSDATRAEQPNITVKGRGSHNFKRHLEVGVLSMK